MANPVKFLRAIESHFVGNVHVQVGKIVESTHPLVAGLEHNYEELKADLIGGLTADEHRAALDAAKAESEVKQDVAKAADEVAKAAS